jgi:hypothetical protein
MFILRFPERLTDILAQTLFTPSLTRADPQSAANQPLAARLVLFISLAHCQCLALSNLSELGILMLTKFTVKLHPCIRSPYALSIAGRYTLPPHDG